MIDLAKTVIVFVENGVATVSYTPDGIEGIVIDVDGDRDICECDPEDRMPFEGGEIGTAEICLNCGCVIEEEW